MKTTAQSGKKIFLSILVPLGIAAIAIVIGLSTKTPTPDFYSQASPTQPTPQPSLGPDYFGYGNYETNGPNPFLEFSDR